MSTRVKCIKTGLGLGIYGILQDRTGISHQKSWCVVFLSNCENFCIRRDSIDVRTLIRTIMFRWPWLYCSMTSRTSYGFLACWNFLRATKYLIFLIALIAFLWASVNLKTMNRHELIGNRWASSLSINWSGLVLRTLCLKSSWNVMKVYSKKTCALVAVL